MEPILDIRGLTKSYSGGLKALDSVDLQVRKGEIFALLGPNGAGKTTLIGAVCGMVRPTSGTIHIDGHDVSDQRANQRNIGMMFQAYALFPNMTVADNVAFGLRVKGVSRAERDARVAEMLQLRR